MKKAQPVKNNPLTLRKCVSTQRISMEIIPQFSSEPYFVRKQQQQNKFLRVNSLTPRKNKIIEIKNYQSNKEKLQKPNQKREIQVKQEFSTRKFNSPFKIQNILPQNYHSQRQIKSKNPQQKPDSGSDQNFSDQKLSSSKSVRFSNRLDDNLSINSKREGSRTPSILKNKNRKYGTGLTSIPSQRSFSVNNSFHSNHKQTKKKLNEESNVNNITKKKYQSLLKGLQVKDNKNKPPLPGRRYFIKAQQKAVKIKYQDDIFPPVYSSIFPPNPKNNKGPSQINGKQIQWKRISEIFPNQKIVLYDIPQALPKYFDSTKQQSKIMKIRITKQKNSYAQQSIVTALNSIKNNEDLLSKIFQNQQVNEYGIYLVKIFQENAWKYIIIDDFIPVVKSNLIDSQNPYLPVFISVKAQTDQKEHKNKRKVSGQKLLPIWPFLLQKAYANYYSSYQALTHGQVLDIVAQFCGISSEKISLIQKTDPQEYLEVIDKLLLGLRNGNVIALAQLKDELPMIPLHYKAQFCYSMITEQQLFYYDPHQQYRPSRIKFYDLGLICTHLFIFTPSKYLQQITCTISKPKHKVSSTLMTKINRDNIFPRDIPTIRKFILKSTCQCSLFIRQKDKRFLHRLAVQYIWLRVILIFKQYDGSYRWIDGEYTNRKGISFNHLLDLGEYFIFLYPQWGKEKYNHDINVSLYCNENLQNFQRIQFNSKQKMLEQACTDLAQKSGKLKQINQYICTYNFVDKKSALIIENIVNQRLHGEVNIARSIIGLKCHVEIVPVNDEFYENLKQKSRQQGASYLAIKKSSIDVKIPKSQSYTVILKMKGGIDNNFFRVFTFGS